MRINFFVLFFLLPFILISQTSSSDYFKSAGKYRDNKEYDKALEQYQLIMLNFPNDLRLLEAKYYIADIQFKNKNYKKSIPIFKSIIGEEHILKNKFPDKIRLNYTTNYKYFSSASLSEYYYEKQMYDSSLFYYNISENIYPLWKFCGQEDEEEFASKLLKFCDLYEKVNQKENAIKKIFEFLFYYKRDDARINKELMKLLNGKKGLKQQLDSSLSNIYSVNKIEHSSNCTYYYMKFLDFEIKLDKDYPDDSFIFSKEELISKIKKSTIYKLIEQME